MDTRILTATTESAGARLDAFLAAQLPGVTRSAAARLIEGGCVTVDGRPAGKSARLQGGERVCVTLPEAEEPEAAFAAAEKSSACVVGSAMPVTLRPLALWKLRTAR